jgi:F-type H+-transporting ATPase subunit alpha
LETSLFYQGVRPAVNVGISVSRVGSAAQIKAMKQVSGSMKLDLAQYREMAAFAQFASDLDASTKNLLTRGAHLTEMLKQPQYQPMAVEDEVLAIFAGVNGFLDKLPLNKVREFELKALREIKANYPEYPAEIVREGKISDELKGKLTEFYRNFSEEFISTLEKAA